MSDPEVPQPDKPADENDVVDSAQAGLDEAAAAPDSVADQDAAATDSAPADAAPAADEPAASDEPAEPAEPAASEQPAAESASVPSEASVEPAIDPDLAAFEAAEREHPGTFGAPAATAEPVAEPDAPTVAAPIAEDTTLDQPAEDKAAELAAAIAASQTINERANIVAEELPAVTSVYDEPVDAETRVLPSEPTIAATAAAAATVPPALQPIFVQAPEPPRDRGNRATAGLIGLLATLAFAVLFLGIVLGLGAINGDVIQDNIGDAALAPLTTWGFWTPVVVFFLSFWLLGAIINRGRWGLWVVFGLLVGVATYFGFILGQLFEAPFWTLTPSQGMELVNEQLFSPLAIAAFVLGRELTIWFGAWVARSGARKTELNIEAQREYERTIEAGPTLPR